MAGNDTIQLLEDGVIAHLPSYANEDDMYAALDKCALTERQIYDELDRRWGTRLDAMSVHELSDNIVAILYDQFDSALLDVTAHKATI